jgi:hypothetical protein
MKDEIINCQKEVNVVDVMDKFISELDQHYRNILLSVASGKYDGSTAGVSRVSIKKPNC